MDYEALIKRYRKKPLLSDSENLVPLQYERGDIKRILPHREPFLFIDEISGLNLEEAEIAGKRYIPKNDPVFQGHFPGNPIYPGCLQVEMTGQMGLCLYAFMEANSSNIDEKTRPPALRATRIISASYLLPVFPEQHLTVYAKKLSYDGFFATAIGQVLNEEGVCCVAISEAVFLE